MKQHLIEKFTYPNLKNHYSTKTSSGDPKLSGPMGKNEFNRYEAWEMLYMINKIFDATGIPKTIEACQKVEYKLTVMPANFKTQKAAFDFIVTYLH